MSLPKQCCTACWLGCSSLCYRDVPPTPRVGHTTEARLSPCRCAHVVLQSIQNRIQPHSCRCELRKNPCTPLHTISSTCLYGSGFHAGHGQQHMTDNRRQTTYNRACTCPCLSQCVLVVRNNFAFRIRNVSTQGRPSNGRSVCRTSSSRNRCFRARLPQIC